MFGSLLSLVVVLLLLNLAPELATPQTPLASGAALAIGVIFYGAILGLITLQNRARRRSPPWFFLLANIELIAFLFFYHYFLAAHRLYWSHSTFLLSIISLSLYYLGLYVYFVTTTKKAKVKARNQIRFLLPFALPFLFFDLVIDLERAMGVHGGIVGMGIATLAMLALLMIFFPWVIQKIWGCRPLPKGELRERLEGLCDRIEFKHAGLKTWPVMRHAMTAAILGVVGRFRYVMFTEGLTKRLDTPEIEAILAHEIGHSRHRHLLFYPLILFGMVTALALYSFLIEEPIELFFHLKYVLEGNSLWMSLKPIALVVPYGVIVVCYFRYLFGFFSRRFERQADLFVFRAGISVEPMVSAFDRIAVASGNSHNKPSWHHYSIAQRIKTLHQADKDPSLIAKHDRKVRRSLVTYLALLAITAFLSLSPFFTSVPLIGGVGRYLVAARDGFGKVLTAPTRNVLATTILPTEYRSNPIIVESVEQSYLEPGAADIGGVADYYAADLLLREGYPQASSFFMERAWHTFDFSRAAPEAKIAFESLTSQIRRALDE